MFHIYSQKSLKKKKPPSLVYLILGFSHDNSHRIIKKMKLAHVSNIIWATYLLSQSK